jgi:hypothetical protein
MNQTKKRLSIINLAISITDIETIQLQVLQLGPLRTDEKIQEILTTLKAENYAQAQGLITTYIETATNEILQRSVQKEQEKNKVQDNNTIDEFNLFTTEDEDKDQSEIRTLDFDDMLAFSNDVVEEKPEKVQKNIDFDSLLNIDKDDILPHNIELDIKHSAANTFWDKSEKPTIDTTEVERDTFFDVEESVSKATQDESDESIEELFTNIMPQTVESSVEKIIPEVFIQQEVIEETKEEMMERPLEEYHTEEELQEEEHQEDVYQEAEYIGTFEEEIKEELEALKPQKKENHLELAATKYKAIPYIDQKFKNMHVQYPPVQETLEIFPSVNAWLLQISNEGYREEEVETMIKQIDSLGIEHKEEAAQLLLITAATESKYAKFRLARALYKGNILQKNLAESFTLINRLATNDDYPEAICDLAQFYEYGIGIDKDKKKAELLYAEAMDSGIKRATDHYERIKKQNRGLFSFLKK